MKDIQSLEQNERVFLAGCIKNIIMADGVFEDSELNELDALIDELDFSDYEESLDRFEEEVHDTESFWEVAETIENEETKELIIDVLYDLSIQKGVEESSEESLILKLKKTWQME